jgi:hypothetical protein
VGDKRPACHYKHGWVPPRCHIRKQFIANDVFKELV